MYHSICTDDSHKSKPSSIPQGSWTLGLMGGGNRCGGDTLLRVTAIHAG